MGLAPDPQPRARAVDPARADVSAQPSGRGLRVVMVVANDVTRDSRVLREAAVLAENGHRVTILGIMTSRTTAPEVELRDGYVIRRLRYRARPPGWWIPPDFYARIRYRSGRQYRIHRARIVALGRQAQRQLRLARDRQPGVPIMLVPGRLSEGVRRRRRALAAAVRSLRRTADRASRLVRRARRAPRAAWSRKARQIVEAGRGPSIGSVGRIWPFRRARRTGRTSQLRGERVPWRRATGQVARPPLHAARAIARGLQAWVGILSLLVWGSFYLAANRVTGGALEWQTGWRWRWLGWAQYVAAHAPEADVWHGHDMTSLPAIAELKRRRGGIAVYDSHEVYLESGRHAEQPRWAKAPLEALERRLVAEVDAVVTVNQSLAAILGQRLGAPDIHVLYNCPPRIPQPTSDGPLRRALGLSDSVPLLLYHGSLAPHRGVEQLLEAINRPELSSAHLAFLGFGPLIDWLRIEARDDRFGGRVHVLDAVPPDELADWLQGVDVAVAPIQPSTMNHRYSSPNKVFEAIAAGTPVAGSDFPEFRRVIDDAQYGPLGRLFDPARPEEIARVVRQLLDAPQAERAALRQRCREASERRWNWETESKSLLAMYAGFASGVTAARHSDAVEVGAA